VEKASRRKAQSADGGRGLHEFRYPLGMVFEDCETTSKSKLVEYPIERSSCRVWFNAILGARGSREARECATLRWKDRSVAVHRDVADLDAVA